VQTLCGCGDEFAIYDLRLHDLRWGGDIPTQQKSDNLHNNKNTEKGVCRKFIFIKILFYNYLKINLSKKEGWIYDCRLHDWRLAIGFLICDRRLNP
jgi:hypothetical protein